MNFFSNVLDSIPVVGHVKGIVHYAVGDAEGGNKAMYQSTRTSAVLAGGAAGCLAGPGGAVVGAMYAGMITDGVATAVMDEPQGLAQSCKNISEDLAAGRNPTGSILSTGFQIGLDGVGGLGMGGVSGAASKVSEKAVSKTLENVGKKVISTVGEEVIEKSVKITAEGMAKVVTKQVTEKAVKQAVKSAAVRAEVILVSTHIGMKASQRLLEEKRAEAEKRENEREREWLAKQEKTWKEWKRQEREEIDGTEMEQRTNNGPESSVSERPPNDDNDPDSNDENELEYDFKEFIKLLREENDRKKREQHAKKEKDRKERERQATEVNNGREREQRANKGRNSSGSGPPPNDDNDPDSNDEDELEKDFKEFMKLLRKILENVYGKQRDPITRIFEGLSKAQKRYLIKVIKVLMKFGSLEAVLELVIRMFKDHLPKNISFPNFLSLLEFVQAHINDQVTLANMQSRGNETTQPRMKYKERKAKQISDILNQTNIVQKLIDIFKKLRDEIEAETAPLNNRLSPDFRDIFSAVSHYFKHRAVPGDGKLTVKQYYDYLRKFLAALKKTPEYARLKRSRETMTIQYDTQVPEYGRRFRIVIRGSGNNDVLCSGYVINIKFPKDDDGEVFIEIKKS